MSHDVGQRLFPPQVEQLTQSFEQQLSMLPANERAGLNLEEFCTVARALITFVYRNTFPSAVSNLTYIVRILYVIVKALPCMCAKKYSTRARMCQEANAARGEVKYCI